MENHYTNIRYHIYRELDKYQKKQEERRSAVINEFAVPVFSGVVATLVASFLSSIEYEGLTQDILYQIIVPIIVYIVILFFARKVVIYTETHIMPNINPLKNNGKGDIDRYLEEYAAKFNFEVTYLVKTAYLLTKESAIEEDELLLRMNTEEVCFYISNALRKISESILLLDGHTSSKVTSNRVSVVMDIIYYILQNLGNRGCNIKEIEILRRKYDDYREPIERSFGVKLQTF